MSTVKPIHGAIGEWRSDEKLATAMYKQAEEFDELTQEESQLLTWFASQFFDKTVELSKISKTAELLTERLVIHLDVLKEIEVVEHDDTGRRTVTFTRNRYILSMDVEGYDESVEHPKTVHLYNEPDNEHYLADAKRLHELCRSASVSYCLSYEDGQNLWNGNITSASPDEEMMTRDYSLSTVMELLIAHVTLLVPRTAKEHLGDQQA